MLDEKSVVANNAPTQMVNYEKVSEILLWLLQLQNLISFGARLEYHINFSLKLHKSIVYMNNGLKDCALCEGVAHSDEATENVHQVFTHTLSSLGLLSFFQLIVKPWTFTSLFILTVLSNLVISSE